jgi:cytochrome oxidase Cu insertion factor (SCO1/SenC/PrrC family)
MNMKTRQSRRQIAKVSHSRSLAYATAGAATALAGSNSAKSRADLEPILAAYDQAVDKRPNESDPQGSLYPTVRVFLIDRESRIRNIHSSGTLDPRLVLADVERLLLEESRLSKQ